MDSFSLGDNARNHDVRSEGSVAAPSGPDLEPRPATAPTAPRPATDPTEPRPATDPTEPRPATDPTAPRPATEPTEALAGLEPSRPSASSRWTAAQRRPSRLAANVARDGVVLRHTLQAMDVREHQIDDLLLSHVMRSEGNGAYRLVGAARTGPTAQRAALAATTGLAICLWTAMAREGLSLRWVRHDPGHVHVLVDHSARIRSTDWYTVHPTRRFDPEAEATYRDEIRTTTIARTIRDFAAFLPFTPASDRQIDAWVDEARSQNRLEVWQIAEAAELERSRKVRKRLKHLHDRHVGVDPAVFKSIGEEWLRNLLERLGLPQPLWNTKPPGAAKASDAYFPWVPLIIEFDGYWVHRPRGKHHRDRAGDRRMLVSHGIPTVRITHWDFEHDLAQLEADLIHLLTRPPLVLPPAA